MNTSGGEPPFTWTETTVYQIPCPCCGEPLVLFLTANGIKVVPQASIPSEDESDDTGEPDEGEGEP